MKKYPVYLICVKYNEDITDSNKRYIHEKNDLPNNRTKSEITHYKMYKEKQDIEKIKQETINIFWLDFIKVHEIDNQNHRMPIVNPTLESIEVSLIHYETWCPTWFSHWTFDSEHTDEEYLQSFNEFVNRVNNYCLMGAEERWRWSGTSDNGKIKTSPPCRCKTCKEKGIVTINH